MDPWPDLLLSDYGEFDRSHVGRGTQMGRKLKIR
jgi:hypothetical protein